MSKRSNGSKNIFVKIMAAILAILMVASMCFTAIYYLYASIR